VVAGAANDSRTKRST